MINRDYVQTVGSFLKVFERLSARGLSLYVRLRDHGQ